MSWHSTTGRLRSLVHCMYPSAATRACTRMLQAFLLSRQLLTSSAASGRGGSSRRECRLGPCPLHRLRCRQSSSPRWGGALRAEAFLLSMGCASFAAACGKGGGPGEGLEPGTDEPKRTGSCTRTLAPISPLYFRQPFPSLRRPGSRSPACKAGPGPRPPAPGYVEYRPAQHKVVNDVP